jgi:LmbE family N-acetylglucosaminyl deacetylase
MLQRDGRKGFRTLPIKKVLILDLSKKILGEKSKIFAVAVSVAWIVNVIIALIIAVIQDKPRDYSLNEKQKILIFAAHQDDCVIEAGGLAAQDIKLGGQVEIVYLTQPRDKEIARIRKKEAHRAWRLLNSNKIRLNFMDYYSDKTWTEEKKTSARNAISLAIERFNPDLVIVPLKEGGHPEHDLLNALTLEVMTHFPDIRVMPAAEYNPYYIMENTPVKALCFLFARLAPFIPHYEPNYGLIPKNQLRLRMTSEELDMKIKMLAEFASEAGVISERQFGYPDLFENTFSLPANNLHLMRKIFSPWTLFTAALTFLMLWSWGMVAAFKYKRRAKYLILVIIICAGSAAIIKGPLFIIEELLFPICFMLGMISAQYLIFYNRITEKSALKA